MYLTEHSQQPLALLWSCDKLTRTALILTETILASNETRERRDEALLASLWHCYHYSYKHRCNVRGLTAAWSRVMQRELAR